MYLQIEQNVVWRYSKFDHAMRNQNFETKSLLYLLNSLVRNVCINMINQILTTRKVGSAKNDTMLIIRVKLMESPITAPA
jgi:hypothetical protein